MKPKDAMPFGERRFVLHFFDSMPDRIKFGRFYLTNCKIALLDGTIAQEKCIAHWPKNRRNVVGQSLGNWLFVPIITELPGDLLLESNINVTKYGSEVSKKVAREWWGEDRAWPAFR